MLAVELGVVCALGIGISALAGRPLFSIVTTYMMVALLGLGTLIAFGLSFSLVQEEDVEVTSSFYSFPAEAGLSSEVMTEDDMVCTTNTFTQTVYHTERITWLLAANPFVVVADAVPYDRAVPEDFAGVGPDAQFRTPGIMEVISDGVRTSLAGADYDVTCAEAQGQANDAAGGQFPIWPLGLVVQGALAGGLLWLGRKKLVTPVRRLAQGTRIA